MQIMGLGAVMVMLPVAVWGWRMMTHRHFDREGAADRKLGLIPMAIRGGTTPTG